MNNNYKIPLPKNFNLGLCLDCGQAFRWSLCDENIWHGIAFGKYLKIQQTDNEIIFHNCNEDDFNKIWKSYFDLNLDYSKILSSYTALAPPINFLLVLAHTTWASPICF